MKIFIIGIAGGIVGTILTIGMIFSFFFLMSRLHTVEAACLPQKETKKGGVACEILEIKDRGNILKSAEIVSLTADETELKGIKDIKTDGKFVEVKVRIKNNGKENLTYPQAYLIDREKRKFSSLWQGRYWLAEDKQMEDNFFPGVEKDVAIISEIPKDAELSKLKIIFSTPNAD